MPPIPRVPSPEKTVAHALLELLKVEGVDRVFGIPGGALIWLLDALKADPDITYHLCRQETGAGYIADGYVRVRGGLAVVVVTSGPGATNALTGALNADAANTPMLVLSGEPKEQFFGRGYLQEGAAARLNLVDVYRGAVGYSELLSSPQNVDDLFGAAMRCAWGPPRRATHLSLPNDVAGADGRAITVATTPAAYRALSQPVDDGGIADAVATLAAATSPLLMLGNACREALRDPALLAELVAAAEHLSLPVITSPEAKGIFPESHELSLRNYGIAGCRWPKHYLTDPDGKQFNALVVFGSTLGGLTTNNWNPILVPDGPFIQIGNDPEMLGRGFPLTRGVFSDLGAGLRSFTSRAMAAGVDPAVAASRRARLAAIKRDFSPWVDPEKRTSTAIPVKPQALARIISDAVPDGSHIFIDSGNCVGWALHEMIIDPPTRAHSSLTMGPMGCATAVVGGKLAAPEATCLALIGDGAFLMQAGEVATAAQYKVGAIWVILADHDLSMVSQGMDASTGDKTYEHYYDVDWSDLATVAQGLGAEAYDVESVAALEDALHTAIDHAGAGVPQVIVVSIDRDEAPPYDYPPVPPRTD